MSATTAGGLDVDSTPPPKSSLSTERVWHSTTTVADMICRGELGHLTGVLPSERAVPYAPLFERLERYGVSVREELQKAAVSGTVTNGA